MAQAQGPSHVVPGCAKQLSTPYSARHSQQNAERQLHRPTDRGLIPIPYTIIYILVVVAPCFKKSFKIRSWVPSPQMP